MRAKPARPAVRYHGGKWKLAPWIISHFPAHRVYVEPFGGGASVLLRKPRAYAEIYNDLDSEIVNLFRVLRDQGEELTRLVSLTPFARDEFDLSYQKTDDPLEQARRTMVRCGMGFGSSAMGDIKTGFRGSATRSGTHPATDWANQAKNLPYIIERLQGTIIENRDALELMRYHDAPTTLHYCDPPYAHETRSWISAKDAYRHELDEDGHRALAECLKSLTGAVLLSGYDCPLYQELFGDWQKKSKEVYVERVQKRTECLWLNDAAARHQQGCLFSGAV